MVLLQQLAFWLLLLCAMYCCLLGLTALLKPSLALQFLQAFATTAGKHHLELWLRMLLGGAFVLQVPTALWPLAFQLFGWLLLGTSTVMLLLPWQWHQRFARHTVPAIAPWLDFIGLVSLLLGCTLLLALLQPLR